MSRIPSAEHLSIFTIECGVTKREVIFKSGVYEMVPTKAGIRLERDRIDGNRMDDRGRG